LIAQAQDSRTRMQPFLVPANLFTEEIAGEVAVWTCIRTRPRWEKSLARWLTGHCYRYFLPTIRRQTTSHRKVRITDHPLFAGYLFVNGDVDKRDLVAADCVVNVLKPVGQVQQQNLHYELWNIWRGLTMGSSLELTRKLEVGQRVKVIAGPMKGVEGHFEQWANGGRLVLGVDMLGIGVAVDVPDTCTVLPLD
jgi:transcription antitermination factor NusG